MVLATVSARYRQRCQRPIQLKGQEKVCSEKQERSYVLYQHGKWSTLVDNNRLQCRYCIDAGKRNTFTTGCSQFKKAALKRHATTSDHRASMVANAAGRRDMQIAVTIAYKSHKRAVIAALQTVYFMAKNNLPNDIFSDLKQFLVLQVGNG